MPEESAHGPNTRTGGLFGASFTRRSFVAAVAGSLVTVGLYLDKPWHALPKSVGEAGTGSPAPSPSAAGGVRLSSPGAAIRRVPAGRLIDVLPGSGDLLALTVDDGTSTEVVGAFIDFVVRTGARLTFFPNGRNASWTDHAGALRPLVDSGQVQLGNHTWSHPDLTKLSDRAIASQITRNERFLQNTYGVSGRPFLRPPYGAHNARVDAIAAELGYSSITMWYGTLGDSSVVTGKTILANAEQWFRPQRIVIGHANHPAVTGVLDQMGQLIASRRLRTVTLDDVFDAPR
jgi:peptidoglycan/xylan/chitin deacetylase (PgdA/CDA1 family)